MLRIPVIEFVCIKDNKPFSSVTVMNEILPKLGCVCPESEDALVEDKIMSYLKVIEEKAFRLLNIQAFTKAEVNRLLQEDSK